MAVGWFSRLATVNVARFLFPGASETAKGPEVDGGVVATGFGSVLFGGYKIQFYEESPLLRAVWTVSKKILGPGKFVKKVELMLNCLNTKKKKNHQETGVFCTR